MTPKTIHFGLAALLCLGNSLSHAQSVTARTGNRAVSRLSQTETLKSGGATGAVDLREALTRSQQPWTRSTFAGQDRNQSLETLYSKTADYLKSPQRVQRVTRMGGMDGGGGNALICQEKGKFTTQLLDLYEAEQLDIEREMGPAPDFIGKIEYVLKRLENVSYARSHIYRAMIADLLTKDTQWVQNSVMPMIDDVKLTTFPRGCLLVQVAVQRPLEQKNIPNARTYIIDRELFQLLDEDSKAALLLHEVMYREARFSGKEDSIFTRHMVGLISSREILKYDLPRFREVLRKNGIRCLEMQPAPTLLSVDLTSSEPCGYAQNYRIPFSGKIKVELLTPDVVLLDLNQQPDKAHQEKVHTLDLTLKGSLGIGSTKAPLGSLQYIVGFGFSGQLQATAYQFNGGIVKFPELVVEDGAFLRVYALRPGMESIADRDRIVLETFLNGAPPDGILQQRYFNSNSIPFDYGHSIIGATQIKHADVKLNSRSELSVDNPYGNAIFFDECLNGTQYSSSDEPHLLVRTGDVRTGHTTDGWHPARSVCFKNGRVSALYYLPAGQASNVPPKEIILIP